MYTNKNSLLLNRQTNIMRTFILTILIACSLMELKADLILGMDIKGDTMALAYRKNIVLVSIQTGKTIFELNYATNAALQSAIKRYENTNTIIHNKKLDAQKHSSEIKLLNLTFLHKELIIGFKCENVDLITKYGLFKLDSAMQFAGLCMIDTPFYKMQPYHTLEIKHGILMTTILDSGYIKLYKYKLDFKTSKAEFLKVENSRAYSIKQQNNPNDSLRYLYSVKGKFYAQYYVFPTPVLYQNNQNLFLNSCCVNFTHYQMFPKLKGDGTYLAFDRQIKQDKYVMLTTGSWNDSLFYLYTFNDTNRVTLEYVDVNKMQYTYRDFKIKTVDTYFILYNRFLYAVQVKEGKIQIRKFKLYN